MESDINITYDYVFKKHYNTVLRYSYKKINNIHDAEDITNEVFVILLKKWDNLVGRDTMNFNVWLLRAAGYLIKEYFRKNKARNKIDNIDDYEDSLSIAYTDEFINEKEEENIYQNYISIIRDKLSPRELELFDAVVVKKMSYSKAAEVLKTSEDSIKMRMFRLREKIKPIIDNIINNIPLISVITFMSYIIVNFL